ncbi:hypothetical protein ASG05_10015 [Frigoribacterium sp. Leaf186]|nr:hypothetical protein ASG05_10015 [Frigoribacterium sp. Leaf186]
MTNPANVADGYTPNAPFTFEGKATPGKTINIENKNGVAIATITVKEDGTWSWTRVNMGTSTWNLNFIQDKGQATEAVAKVLGFKPNAAPAPVVTVTNPANVADGYTANAPFTFEGKGTPGKTINIENKNDVAIATITVKADGTWSWTRSNMGTSTWNLNFIQDKGQTGEAVAKVEGFKPRA